MTRSLTAKFHSHLLGCDQRQAPRNQPCVLLSAISSHRRHHHLLQSPLLLCDLRNSNSQNLQHTTAESSTKLSLCDPNLKTSTPSRSARRRQSAFARSTPTASRYDISLSSFGPFPNPLRLCQYQSSHADGRVTGHLRKGREVGHRYHRQEEVSGARRPHSRPVRLRYPEAHQTLAREGHLYLRR